VVEGSEVVAVVVEGFEVAAVMVWAAAVADLGLSRLWWIISVGGTLMVVVVGRSHRRSWLRGEPVGGVGGRKDDHHRYPRVVLALHIRWDWRGGRDQRKGREGRPVARPPRLGFQNRYCLLFRLVFRLYEFRSQNFAFCLLVYKNSLISPF
jgi:hypothetical protein